jgi:hypothetical protein
MRPFYFGVVLWGPEFRGYFLDFCLASLLAPENIPALEDNESARFLVCTTAADWAAMSEHPTFQLLGRHIRPELIEIEHPHDRDDKMRVMSYGHRMIADAMHEAKAYGVYVYPDTVFSRRVVFEAQRLAKEGRKCVLAHCPRFANEGFLADLRSREMVKPGVPIVLSGGALIARAYPYMHSENLRYDWDSKYFYAMSPPLVYWRLPDRGLLCHTTAWAPMLVDYGRLAEHDTWALDNWTIDGDYIHRNFPIPGDVHAVTDAESMTLISFTPETSFTYFPLQRPPDNSFARKIVWLNAYLRKKDVVDPLKRELFRLPLAVNQRPASLSWLLVRLRSRAILALVLAPAWTMLPFRSWLRLRRLGLLGWWWAKPKLYEVYAPLRQNYRFLMVLFGPRRRRRRRHGKRWLKDGWRYAPCRMRDARLALRRESRFCAHMYFPAMLPRVNRLLREMETWPDRPAAWRIDFTRWIATNRRYLTMLLG